MAARNREPEMVYCFVDTNILIHRTTFDEVDWPGIMDVGDVCLVLAPAVLNELDKHKNENKDDWIQGRARMLIGKLRTYLRDPRYAAGEPIPVRDHVSLLILAREPEVDWHSLGLDPGWGDDRILASISQLQLERPTADVRVVAHDTAMVAKAVRCGVSVVDEDRIAELPRASTLSRELERTQRELQELKQRMPRLEFGFWEDKRLVTFVTRHRGTPRTESASPSDEEIARRISGDRAVIEAALQAGEGKVASEDLERYRERGANYLRRLAMALPMQRSRVYGPMCTLTFALHNAGSAPANGIELEVALPVDSFVVGLADRRKRLFTEVEVPKLPKAAWMRKPRPDPYGFDAMAAALNPPLLPSGLGSRASAPPRPGPRGPLYDFDGERRYVWYETPKLLAGQTWYLEQVAAYVPATLKGGFAIEWAVHADELSKPMKGKLNVKLEEVKAGTTKPERRG